MTAQEYIESVLKQLVEPIEYEDIGNSNVEDAIYAKVMSKKFRKLKVDEETIKVTKTAIARAVAANKPITIGLLFGAINFGDLKNRPNRIGLSYSVRSTT